MKLANGVGTVYKLSGNRCNPYIVRKTVGWDIDTATGKRKQQYITIGYAPTKAKGLEMLMEYIKNPYDIEASKITFAEVFESGRQRSLPRSQTATPKPTKHHIIPVKSCTTECSRI
jgi:hypothetical protein